MRAPATKRGATEVSNNVETRTSYPLFFLAVAFSGATAIARQAADVDRRFRVLRVETLPVCRQQHTVVQQTHGLQTMTARRTVETKTAAELS